jgi:hypothetical protein
MNRILGMLIGVGYFGMVFYAFNVAQAGWAADQPDVGFWWFVIAGFLTVAAVGAIYGTWIHTRPNQR